MPLTFNGPKSLSVKKGGNSLDGVNDGARSEIIRLADLIASSEGINTLDLATRRGKLKPTVEKYLKLAKLLGIIEFWGASKTGEYFLTKKMKEKLKD